MKRIFYFLIAMIIAIQSFSQFTLNEGFEGAIFLASTSTSSDSITVFPWTEGFETDWVPANFPGNKQSPNCWTVVDKGSINNAAYEGYFWTSNLNMYYPGTSHSGARHAVINTDEGLSNHNDWLITPKIVLTGNERLRFWAMRQDAASAEPEEISVFISDNSLTALDTTGMGVFGNITWFYSNIQSTIASRRLATI